jgi:hypothetical protein
MVIICGARRLNPNIPNKGRWISTLFLKCKNTFVHKKF